MPRTRHHGGLNTGNIDCPVRAPAGSGARAGFPKIDALAPEGDRHLLTFEGHVTLLPDRDRGLLEYIDLKNTVGDAARIGRQLERLAGFGYREIVYTPTGPDVPRELRAFAAVR